MQVLWLYTELRKMHRTLTVSLSMLVFMIFLVGVGATSVTAYNPTLSTQPTQQRIIGPLVDYYWNGCNGSPYHAFAEAVPYYGAGNKIELHYSFPSSISIGAWPFCWGAGFGYMYFYEHDITQGWTYGIPTNYYDNHAADDIVYTIPYSIKLGDYVTITLYGNYGCLGDVCSWGTPGIVIFNCHVTQSYQYCE